MNKNFSHAEVVGHEGVEIPSPDLVATAIKEITHLVDRRIAAFRTDLLRDCAKDYNDRVKMPAICEMCCKVRAVPPSRFCAQCEVDL